MVDNNQKSEIDKQTNKGSTSPSISLLKSSSKLFNHIYSLYEYSEFGTHFK